MKPYQAYQENRDLQIPRIEMLLRLYDGLLSLLEQARDLSQKGDDLSGGPLLARAQAIVAGLAGSVDLSYGEVPMSFLRLYDYVLYTLSSDRAGRIDEALRTLTPLREGLRGIRAEALELERSGAIPSLGVERNVLARA